MVTARWFAVILAGFGGDCFLRAQTPPATPDSPTQIVLLLPVGLKGWVCTDFGVPDAPPLPREGDALIVRARSGEILTTSDKPIQDSRGRDYFSGQVWWGNGGQRQPVPEDFRLQRGNGSQRKTLDGSLVNRECALFTSRRERNSV